MRYVIEELLVDRLNVERWKFDASNVFYIKSDNVIVLIEGRSPVTGS